MKCGIFEWMQVLWPQGEQMNHICKEKKKKKSVIRLWIRRSMIKSPSQCLHLVTMFVQTCEMWPFFSVSQSQRLNSIIQQDVVNSATTNVAVATEMPSHCITSHSYSTNCTEGLYSCPKFTYCMLRKLPFRPFLHVFSHRLGLSKSLNSFFYKACCDERCQENQVSLHPKYYNH